MKVFFRKWGASDAASFLAIVTVISVFAQNWMGVVASVGIFLLLFFFLHYQSILSHKFFRLILQLVLFGSVLSAALRV